jgi:hypothetical protein
MSGHIVQRYTLAFRIFKFIGHADRSHVADPASTRFRIGFIWNDLKLLAAR